MTTKYYPNDICVLVDSLISSSIQIEVNENVDAGIRIVSNELSTIYNNSDFGGISNFSLMIKDKSSR